jgi:hypothetical protein
MSIPAPTQAKLSVSDYFDCFKLYTIGTGRDLDDPDIRVKFMAGLTLDNQKEFIRFGVKKPLIEIVTYLKSLESRSETNRYAFGDMFQGDDSVALFYAKTKKYNAIINLSKEALKYNFIRGLNSKNQLEVQLIYTIDPNISLEELINKLSRLEALSKLKEEHPSYFL